MTLYILDYQLQRRRKKWQVKLFVSWSETMTVIRTRQLMYLLWVYNMILYFINNMRSG